MRKLIWTIVVVLLLLTAADFGARWVADDRAESAIATHSAELGAPDVTVHGFPFLTQAVRGRYQNITLTSNDVTLGTITGVQARIDLFAVTLPLSDALSGDLSALAAGRGTVRAVITAGALAAALGRPDLTLAAAGDGFVRIGTTIAVAGRMLDVTADASVSVSDGVLHVAARPVSAAGFEIPANVSQSIGARLSVNIPLSGLPFPITSATVTSTGSDLVVTAAAKDITAAGMKWAAPARG